MKKSLSKNPPEVKKKSRLERFKSAYPLLWGWKNTAINAFPFLLAWLCLDANHTAMMLAAWFCMLVYCLRENARNNRLLRNAKKLGGE